MCGLNCVNLSETGMDIVFELEREMEGKLRWFLCEKGPEELGTPDLDIEDYISIQNFDLSYDPKATREEGRYELKFDLIFIGTKEWEEGNEEIETLSFIFPPKFSKEKIFRRVWNKIVTRRKLEEKGFKKFDIDYSSWF